MSSSKKSSKSKTGDVAARTAAVGGATKKSVVAATGGAKSSSSAKTASGTAKAPSVKAAAKSAASTGVKKSGVSAKAVGTTPDVASAKPVTQKAPVATDAEKVRTTGKTASSATPTGSKANVSAPAREATPAPSAAKTVTTAKTETTKKLASRNIAPVGKATVAALSSTPARADAGVQTAPAAEKPVAPVSVGKAPAQNTPVREPEKALAATVAKPKATTPKNGFRLNEFIVYPAHGVGQIIGVEVQEVAGFSLELYVVSFIKDKMILKVPTSKVTAVGMRKLAETNIVEKALSTLSGRARVKRTMWSRRAQEYEAKINSGDLVTIAEVVRDLYRSDSQPEQSYSERQLYEAALDRMSREISAVRRLIDAEALKLIESFLQKGPRRGAKSDSEVDGDIDGDDADVDRAA